VRTRPVPWYRKLPLSACQFNDLDVRRAGGHGQNGLMRIKLIEELPMATSAELYQFSWVIEQLLADPRRIVQVRAQLHTGQQIRYLSWHDGKLRSARVVGMHGDHVAIHDAAYSKAFKVHYAAILTEPTNAPTESGRTPGDVELGRPSPPPEVAGRAVPTSASATE
jgi:ribosomal protein L35AE/L33A